MQHRQRLVAEDGRLRGAERLGQKRVARLGQLRSTVLGRLQHRPGDRQHFARQRIIVGKQPADDMPQRNHAGTGQRGDVNDRCRLKPFGIGQGVAEDQPALGIGVEDFHGLS